ncbi:MAG: hypothetical protein KAH25_04590, partial [Bacteroidales bacterium]|nr:hypothetical protein [Bacteroidales bacterium]
MFRFVYFALCVLGNKSVADKNDEYQDDKEDKREVFLRTFARNNTAIQNGAYIAKEEAFGFPTLTFVFRFVLYVFNLIHL